MQSTFKFPLALYILHLVDEHKLALDKSYPINTAILDTDTWSPIVKEHPLQKLSLTLQDLLMYSVSYSDNNACDLLFGCSALREAQTRWTILYTMRASAPLP
jgi:beta-lactamase class A